MPQPLLLDPAGDAPLPANYQRLSTEVAWLRTAAALPLAELPPPAVVVSGSDLCAWAERWWRGWGGTCQTLHSPSDHLLAACPALSRADASQVLLELGAAWHTKPGPWTLSDVLETLYPSFSQPYNLSVSWAAQPASLSARTALAAHWLLWSTSQPKPWPIAHQPLLSQLLASWGGSEAAGLFPLVTEESLALLRRWLGFEATPQGSLVQRAGAFPLSVPPQWLGEARQLHEQQLAALNQTHLSADELRQRLAAWWKQRGHANLPLSIQELAAAQYAEFLLANPHLLQASHLRELLPVLGTTWQAQRLKQELPPTEPDNLPSNATVSNALNWVTDNYLPYRHWQASFTKPPVEPTQRVAELAAQFEDWLLAHYPAMLVSPNNGLLHIHKAESLRFATTQEATLWVVPDGLGWLDAATLAEKLHILAAGRLAAPKATPCLGLLPTITSLTKQPLLHSTTARSLPLARPNTQRRERLIAGHLDPAEALRNAVPGDLFIWTPPDPDSAYHGQFDCATIQQRVTQLLQVLAQQLASAVQAVPVAVPLRVVIATDHGRLLGSSARTVVIPAGFESHGRAVYAAQSNQTNIPSPTDLARPDLAWLEPEAFGLPYWAAAVRGESSFRTNNTDATGLLHFPHGGLWPEEVVVPWITLERAAAVVPLTATLIGHGLARRRADLTLSLTNPTKQAYTLLSLTLEGPDDFTVALSLAGQMLPATATHAQPLSLELWPTPTQVRGLRARLQLADAQGRPAELGEVQLQLTSEDFEEGPDLDLNF